MNMDRRGFLRSLALTATGLYVMPDLLEEPARRIFAVGIDLRSPGRITNGEMLLARLNDILRYAQRSPA